MIGGAPMVRLKGDEGPGIVSADIAPGRGMMLLQARAQVPGLGEIDLIATPPDFARLLDDGPDDFAGNRAFAFGGAILLPYANRIRGRALEGRREIEADVAGRRVRLPRNWGGKAEGAEQYAMHGLILNRAMDQVEQTSGHVRGVLRAGDFGGRWPGALEASFEYGLALGVLTLMVEVRNVGDEATPAGVGWHPYFNLPSGDRAQARLYAPARARTLVNDYDEVLPTGETAPVLGTAHDVGQQNGLTLGDLYLDDCFVDLQPSDGRIAIEVVDPAADFGLRIVADAPPVKAVQVYAPPDKPFVVVEPQYNWANPFGPEWKGADTGMVMLEPGQATTYRVSLEVFTP